MRHVRDRIAGPRITTPGRWVAGIAVSAVCGLVAPTAAVAEPDSGPPLTVPRASLDNALRCSADLTSSHRQPVLLVPGTGLDPDQFSWNYVPALQKRKIPHCTVTLPNKGMSDIQVAGEYVVNAIRTMNAKSDRKVQIIGHSQGGMVPRWALKYWPDTRERTDDLIGLGPSNHGTLDAHAICAPGCAPAVHQQKTRSRFLTALNFDAETYPGISYTNVASRYDEVVVPNAGERASSFLRTGGGDISNVDIQSRCPANTAEHVTTGTSDPVSYALAMDALNHPGPADPARVSEQVCVKPFMPAVDPVTFPTNFGNVVATAADQFLLGEKVAEEPPLKDYAVADRS